jgi:RHS repeat-associated protein
MTQHFSGSAGRNSEFGQSDIVNQKFTGQEYDPESGLDFFKARYLSAALGRFSSPDPHTGTVAPPHKPSAMEQVCVCP